MEVVSNCKYLLTKLFGFANYIMWLKGMPNYKANNLNHIIKKSYTKSLMTCLREAIREITRNAI